jgi:hypothetical protein
MTDLMYVWLAFNIVFGCFTFNNFRIWVWAKISMRHYSQNDLGRMLDYFIIVSCLSQYLIINGV